MPNNKRTHVDGRLRSESVKGDGGVRKTSSKVSGSTVKAAPSGNSGYVVTKGKASKTSKEAVSRNAGRFSDALIRLSHR